jgi:predicted RNA-binding Zn ribbon-like protein
MKKQSIDDEFTPQSPWLDLVNSQQWDGFGRMTDHLQDAVWIARFVQYWNWPQNKPVRRAHRMQLTTLRALLRKVSEKVASGKSLAKSEQQALNAILKTPVYAQLAVKGDRLHTEFVPMRFNWKWITSQVVMSFIETLESEPRRIKICSNDQCRWAFLDRTKSNNRRWCNDRRCGNRDRVRRARARAIRQVKAS